MNVKIRIFLNSIILYGCTAVLSLVAAWRHIADPLIAGVVGPLEFSMQNAVIFLGVFIVFTYVMVRFIRMARYSLFFFLAIALVAGSQFVFASWIAGPWSILASLILVLLVWRVPVVFIHDCAVALGIGGIAAILGLAMTPLIACVLLAALALYDIVSVYRTRHMVTLATRMLESGAVFGFLVPASFRGLLMRRDDAIRAKSVMMLGSGDIGLPLVLATSAVSQSIPAAVLVAACSLIGVSAMHWLFVHQNRPEPMAALPPIAVSAILGYTLAIFLGI